MATLKDHQQAMVDLMASGSGIPASAMRLAHAMHDVLCYLNSDNPIELDIKSVIRRVQTNSPGLNDKAISKREKPVKTDSPAKWPLKQQPTSTSVDISMSKPDLLTRARDAERRVRELENTVRQLRAQSVCQREEIARLKQDNATLLDNLTQQLNIDAEQAGCRKDDTQVCDHQWFIDTYEGRETGNRNCKKCGAHETYLPECEHEWVNMPGLFIATGDSRNTPPYDYCRKCGVKQ